MAETSYLWDNPGTGDSPALGYGNATLNQVIFRMLFNGTGNQGVLMGWLNDLEVTDGGGLNAAVDTGGAFCYGVWYENDAATNIAIANNATEWVVVRASWATQTSRLTAIAPGAFTQTAGVTYDIPLAEVTTVAGAITLITDLRDYCTFSTVVWPFGVTEDMLVADSVTIAKMIDQERWFEKGCGSFAPDGTNAAAWYCGGSSGVWEFQNTVTDAVWGTFRVPTDITSANLDIDIWIDGDTAMHGGGDVRWTYSIWQAASGAVAANTAGATITTMPSTGVWLGGFKIYTLVSQPVTAGDLLHIQLARTGAHAADTYTPDIWFYAMHCSYTADS